MREESYKEAIKLSGMEFTTTDEVSKTVHGERFPKDALDKINYILADVILENQFTWAEDINNAKIYYQDGRLFLDVEKEYTLEAIELVNGQMYTEESFCYLTSEEASSLFAIIQEQSDIRLFLKGEEYLNRPYNNDSEMLNQISREDPSVQTIVFDNITPAMTNGQVYQILWGVKDGLDVTEYSNPLYNYKQMFNIRMGMLQQLPYDLYMDYGIEADKMQIFREAMLSGVEPGLIGELIQKQEHTNIDLIELEEIMDNLIDTSSEVLRYYIYKSDIAGNVSGEGFVTDSYEEATEKWRELGDINKAFGIYNKNIHEENGMPVILMNFTNGDEHLVLNPTVEASLESDGIGEAIRTQSPLMNVEKRLISDFGLDLDYERLCGVVRAKAKTAGVDNTNQTPTKRLFDELEKGVENVYKSGKYQSYLDTMSRFYNYSYNNQLLIFLQRPDATLVRGYGDSKNARGGWFDFGRQVAFGEKAIKILAPLFVTEKFKGELFNDAMNNLKHQNLYTVPYTDISILRNNDNTFSITNAHIIAKEHISKEQVKNYLNRCVINKALCGFKAVNVFDISQCKIRQVEDKEGNKINDPRAEKAVLSLTGDVNNINPVKMDLLYDVLREISEKNGVPLKVEATNRGNGYYDLNEKKIVISDRLNESHQVKTAIHEIAHSRLHNDVSALRKSDIKSEWEIQAESIAYVVSKELGLDTADYSFGYIAGWSEDKELSQLKSSMDIISKESKRLINDIDKELDARGLDRATLLLDDKNINNEGSFSFYETYKKDPFLAFSSFKNDLKNHNNEQRDLSDNDLYFMANSKFIKERFSSSLKHTPEKFIKKSLEQLDKVKGIEGFGNKPFVEISFCEKLLEKPVFEDGEVLSVRDADLIFSKAEFYIRDKKLKTAERQDSSSGISFPCMKCYASVYIPIEEDGQDMLAVIHTRTEIGDGCQIGLIDAIKHSDKLKDINPVIKNQIICSLSSESSEVTQADLGFSGKLQKLSKYKEAAGKEMKALNQKNKVMEKGESI